MIVEAELRGGVIYGDRANGEYVYMPASEVGANNGMRALDLVVDCLANVMEKPCALSGGGVHSQL